MLKVDNTMLSCFTTCPKKFYWRHVRHLVRNTGKVPALEFGKAIHKGLEVYYKGSTPEQAIEAFKTDLDTEATDDKRNHDSGGKILKGYFKHWGKEKWEVIAVEQNLSAPITDNITLYGYIDLVVKQQDFRYNVEHKTSSNFSWFIDNPNHQISGYVYLSQKNGFPVEGSIVNILGVFKTKTEFKRTMTSRTGEQMVDYLEYVKRTASQIQRCKDTNFYPKYTNSCYNCSFKNLCTTPSELVDRIIDIDFKQEEWTPWEER